MGFVNPLAKARGLGSAQSGTDHWWKQRATALLLLPLSAWVLYAVVALTGAEYIEVRAFIADPVHAGAALLLAGALFWHAQLGLQVVIEDYVHTPWLEITLQLLVRLTALAGFVAAGIAILMIALNP